MNLTGDMPVDFCLQDGQTALHMAAQEGRVDVVRLLTEAKANVNIQDAVHTMYTVSPMVLATIPMLSFIAATL